MEREGKVKGREVPSELDEINRCCKNGKQVEFLSHNQEECDKELGMTTTRGSCCCFISSPSPSTVEVHLFGSSDK